MKVFSTFDVTCISGTRLFSTQSNNNKKKLWSKATKRIQLLIISNVITAKFSSYGMTRHEQFWDLRVPTDGGDTELPDAYGRNIKIAISIYLLWGPRK